MAFKQFDRVKDTSTTTGTGTLTLANSAPTGYRTFGSVLSANDTTIYCIEHQSANEWEVGIGIYSSNTLARDSIISSSNSNNAVSLSAGTKNVFITVCADQVAYKSDTYANLSSYSAPIAGVQYHATDSPYTKMVSNGTLSSSIAGGSQVGNVYSFLWDHYLPLGGKCGTVPIISTQYGVLTGAINNSTTTVINSTVSYATGVLQVLPFMIQIDSEVMLVTAKSGATYTVTRGYDGTSAASHADQAAITWIGWRWVNQDGATATTTYGGIEIYHAARAGAHSNNLYMRAVPTVPYTGVIFGFTLAPYLQYYTMCGVGWRDSSTGNLQLFTFYLYDGTYSVFSRFNWTSATAFSAGTALSNAYAFYIPPLVWIKLVDDNTNRLTYISYNRKRWILVDTVTRTNHVATPNQMVWGVNAYNREAGMTLVDFEIL